MRIIIIFIFFLFACSSPERDNINDPKNKGEQIDICNLSNIEFDSLKYGDKIYKTVVIGDQTWMAENLNYNLEGSKCYGEDIEGFTNEEVKNNCEKYGRLYSWDVAMNVCPDGWHLPFDEEWAELIHYAGDIDVAKKLKSKCGWEENGSDDYGFTALPGGFCSPLGYSYCDGIYSEGYWWTASTVENSYDAICRTIRYSDYNNDVQKINPYKEDGYYLYNVRCIKDSSTLLTCNDKNYYPELEFCYENEIYSLCKGIRYNPTSAKCEDDILLDSKCGNSFYNPETHFCYYNNIYKLCNEEEYNPITHDCLENIAFAKCGNNFYNDKIESCCNENDVFNINTHFCRDKNIHEKIEIDLYKAVTIGTQTWMAENLHEEISGSRCYEDKPENCEVFGFMYDWNTAMKACPVGWHLPTSVDWSTLSNSSHISVIIDELKANSSLWVSGGGTDDFGFSALPGGLYYNDRFMEKGEDVYFWSTNKNSEGYVHVLNLDNWTIGLRNTHLSTEKALAYVRCVKD